MSTYAVDPSAAAELTGLANRRLFASRLDAALIKRVEAHQLGVLFLDLDGFKAVNDTYGHDAGDEFGVLADTGEASAAVLRRADAAMYAVERARPARTR